MKKDYLKFNDWVKAVVLRKVWYLQCEKTSSLKDGKLVPYPICYRMLILHALRNYYLKTADCTHFQICKSIEDIYVLVSNLSNPNPNMKGLYIPHFVEIYPFLDESGKVGATLVDRSKACFPLIMYPEKDELHGKGNRHGALYKSLEELNGIRSQIADVIIKHSKKGSQPINDDTMEVQFDEFKIEVTKILKNFNTGKAA